MSNLFVVADTHFCHENVIKYNNRPFKDVYEMNDQLIERWNKVVTKRDRVKILGDFAWDRHGFFLNVLNGKKELVIGSHDKMAKVHLDCFSKVSMIDIFNFGGKTFVCSHCCMRVWELSHYGSVHLFGHSHGRLKTYNLSFDVGVDAWGSDYAPIPMEEVMARVKKREEQMKNAGRIKPEERKGKTVTIYYQDDLAFFDMERARNKTDNPGY